jgi:competence protein ComEA
MDIVGEEHGRVARLASWLGATRAELTGLVVLLLGAVLATGALWWSAVGSSPPEPPPPDIAMGPQAGMSHERHEGPAHGGHDGERDHAGVDGGASSDASGSGPSDAAAPLTVHVSGAVASPGVITVAAGARVADAIAAAGEATAAGEPHRLNLARPLTDGEQIHVPREGEELAAPDAGGGPDGGSGGGVDATGLIDLNRADAATLETLPGIGPARAEAIVEYREEHGPFTEPGDLRGVSGIGEVIFQRLAEDVTVS